MDGDPNGDDQRSERSSFTADYNRSEHWLTLTNSAVIVLEVADAWNRYVDNESGAIWLDELSHYETDLHDLLEMLGNCF